MQPNAPVTRVVMGPNDITGLAGGPARGPWVNAFSFRASRARRRLANAARFMRSADGALLGSRPGLSPRGSRHDDEMDLAVDRDPARRLRGAGETGVGIGRMEAMRAPASRSVSLTDRLKGRGVLSVMQHGADGSEVPYTIKTAEEDYGS